MLYINIKKEKAQKITCLIRYGNIFFAFSFSLNHLKVGLLSRKNQREEGKGESSTVQVTHMNIYLICTKR